MSELVLCLIQLLGHLQRRNDREVVEIFELSKIRLLGLTQPCFAICLAKGANSFTSVSDSRVFLTVPT
jgi:hypothetical protein